MKLLVVADDVPFRGHGDPAVTAVNIVLFLLLKELQNLGNDIVYQCILPERRAEGELTSAEQLEIAALQELGINVLPPLFPGALFKRVCHRFSFLSLLFNASARLSHFYPSVRLSTIMVERARSSDAEAILTIWSPRGVAATDGVPLPRVSYQGDVDYQPKISHLRDERLFSATKRGGLFSFFQRLSERLKLWLFVRTHHALMNRVDVIANVTASNAPIYTRRGHRRSLYVGNTWMDHGVCPLPQRSASAPLRIIGHVGHLAMTGTGYGLQFLLRDVLPHLPRFFGRHPYEVHIIGGGEVPLSLRPLLRDPHIVLHGFVHDLDAALSMSDVFCIFNNVGSYAAAYTRHIVAWSLGLCLVAHERSTLAIPEIIHGRNALTASEGSTAARAIADAALDPSLNARLRLEGRRTYDRHFVPGILARKLSGILSDVIVCPLSL